MNSKVLLDLRFWHKPVARCSNLRLSTSFAGISVRVIEHHAPAFPDYKQSVQEDSTALRNISQAYNVFRIKITVWQGGL